MEMRKCGKGGLRLSVLGIGCRESAASDRTQ